MTDEEKVVPSESEILVQLKMLGVGIVNMPYSGSGDDGSISEVYAHRLGGTPGTPNIRLPKELDDALMTIGHDYLEELHSGWYNEEGASGEVTLNVQEGTLYVDHNEYYQESNNYTHERDFGDEMLVSSESLPPLTPQDPPKQSSVAPVCTCLNLMKGHQPGCPYKADLQRRGL